MEKDILKLIFGVYTKDEDVYIADMAYSEKGTILYMLMALRSGAKVFY